MKNHLPVVLIILVAASLSLSSCSKDKAGPVTLTGNWNLVKDSVVTIGSGANIAPPTVINVYDKAGDYYNFSVNGHLYMQVNGIPDTATYTLQNNQVSINYTIYYSQTRTGTYTTPYAINSLSAHSVVLVNPGQFAAPFLTKETIRLSR